MKLITALGTGLDVLSLAAAIAAAGSVFGVVPFDPGALAVFSVVSFTAGAVVADRGIPFRKRSYVCAGCGWHTTSRHAIPLSYRVAAHMTHNHREEMPMVEFGKTRDVDGMPLVGFTYNRIRRDVPDESEMEMLVSDDAMAILADSDANQRLHVVTDGPEQPEPSALLPRDVYVVTKHERDFLVAEGGERGS